MSLEFDKIWKYHTQNKLFSLFQTLENAVRQNYFTAWSAGNSRWALSCFLLDEIKVTKNEQNEIAHPFFDLSSVTKPLFIHLLLPNTSFKNNLSSPIPWEPLQSINANLSIQNLMNHTSGFLPWLWFGNFETIENLTHKIIKKMNQSFPNCQYSDLNYYMLARIFEKEIIAKNENMSWESIQKNVFNKFDLYHASLCQQIHSIPFFPYTHVSIEQKAQKNFGLVHDTNANILALQQTQSPVVSAHAGFFGNILSIRKAINHLENRGLFEQCFDYKTKHKTDRFVFGFDTPSNSNSACGILNWEQDSEQIFGHLGYTGTSFWVNSKTKKFHTLLTNRVGQRTNNHDSSQRIFILEDLILNKKYLFLKEKNSWRPSCADEITEINQLFFSKNTLVWNDQVIPNYANILQERIKTGNILWEI